MTDLHTRLRSAIEERLTLAELAGRGWPSIIGIVEGDPPFVAPDQISEHIALNDPAFVIRACRADLARLERHRLCHCDLSLQLGHCFTHKCGAGWPCPEVRSLAEVWLRGAPDPSRS